MASHLIGVMGKKRHGKDTFAARLTSTHAYARLAFADPMRDAIYSLDPLIRVEADETGPLAAAGCYVEPGRVVRLSFLVDAAGWEAAKALREVRRLLQEYGTGLRVTTYEDVWVDTTLRLAEDVLGPVVITDVRFPNEVDAVRAQGGLLVYIVNPNVPEAHDPHPSENAVDRSDADVIVWNGGTIEDLHREADTIIRGLSY